MKELGRLQLHLAETSSTRYKGYLSVNGRLKPLPTGSLMDIERGIFYWQPGYGYYGQYTFEFFTYGVNGEMTRKSITINIVPKFK